MRLSEDRISHLSRQILDALWRDDLIEYREEAQALRTLKETLSRLAGAEDEVDTLVRQRLARQNKNPGSREWQVLYDRYFKEEMSKRR